MSSKQWTAWLLAIAYVGSQAITWPLLLCKDVYGTLNSELLCLHRFAPFPKTKMAKLLGDVEDAKALLAKGS